MLITLLFSIFFCHADTLSLHAADAAYACCDAAASLPLMMPPLRRCRLMLMRCHADAYADDTLSMLPYAFHCRYTLITLTPMLLIYFPLFALRAAAAMPCCCFRLLRYATTWSLIRR